MDRRVKKQNLVEMKTVQGFRSAPPPAGLISLLWMITFEPVEKTLKARICHSERSEESLCFKELRPFTSFRVTQKRVFRQTHPQGA
jgi:hypothetical protein